MGPSEESRRTATYLRNALGVPCQIHRYLDEKEDSAVYVLTASGAPSEGLSTYATASLSDHPTGFDAYGQPLRVELLFAVSSDAEQAPNIVSTCAFNAINSDWPVTLNAMHPGVVRMYYPERQMAHVILVSPFSFKLETQRLPSRTVAWLQILPVSEGELAFAEGHGVGALEKRLEVAGIDAFDLGRPSIF